MLVLRTSHSAARAIYFEKNALAQESLRVVIAVECGLIPIFMAVMILKDIKNDHTV